MRCKSRFSNGFTASALNALPSSIAFRFALRCVAEPRPEVTGRRCDTPLLPGRTAGLRRANGAACRPNQSRADAIIGRRESADFRGHPGAVTDAPGLGFSATWRVCTRGDGHGPSPCLTHLLMTKTTAPATRRDAQALPSGTATNLVASPIRTRIRTVCLPLVFASLSALRTSPTLVTGLPATSRMTLPR